MLGLETLYGFLVILALFAFYRLWRNPTLGNAALLALCLSLATLTRSEGAMLFVFFALPTLILVPRASVRRKFELFGVVVAVTLVVVGPWTVRNLTTFEKPSAARAAGSVGCCSTAAATRRSTARKVGYWSDACSLKDYPPDTDETVLDEMARKKAFDYLGDHKGRLPVVVAARVGRIWDVYRPFQNVEFNDKSERRGHAASWAVLIGYWLVMPFAIFGLVVMRRRRIPIFPYFAIALSVTITVALSFGITRYRAPVDTVLPLLAAIGIDSIWRHRRPPAVTTTGRRDTGGAPRRRGPGVSTR